MDIIFGLLATGCLGYLITEINDLQREVRDLRSDVIFVQVQLDRRGLTPKAEG